MPLTIEAFKRAHTRIDTALSAGEALVETPEKLSAHLQSVRAEVLQHFQAKDLFYPALAEQCTKAGDTAGAHLTHIFESNMKVQSAAVQRFFETLETAPRNQLVPSFQTVATVIRQRFGTEERAVFPLFVRTAKALGGA